MALFYLERPTANHFIVFYFAKYQISYLWYLGFSILHIYISFYYEYFCYFQDLVKSHLMFAVREEVEVLKEKIAELMDRINQLEMENTVLKANASQETLAQLSSSLQPPPSNAP